MENPPKNFKASSIIFIQVTTFKPQNLHKWQIYFHPSWNPPQNFYVKYKHKTNTEISYKRRLICVITFYV